jgi:hypothetical protein
MKAIVQIANDAISTVDMFSIVIESHAKRREEANFASAAFWAQYTATCTFSIDECIID